MQWSTAAGATAGQWQWATGMNGRKTANRMFSDNGGGMECRARDLTGIADLPGRGEACTCAELIVLFCFALLATLGVPVVA